MYFGIWNNNSYETSSPYFNIFPVMFVKPDITLLGNGTINPPYQIKN